VVCIFFFFFKKIDPTYSSVMSKTAIFCCFQSLAVCEAFFLLSLEISGANNLTKKGEIFCVS